MFSTTYYVQFSDYLDNFTQVSLIPYQNSCFLLLNNYSKSPSSFVYILLKISYS